MSETLFGTPESAAVFSVNRQYRYRLERTTSIAPHGRVAAFLMVNPSKADAQTNDQTITKVMGFASQLALRKVIVGNKFAHVATDITELRGVADPVGPDNDAHLERMMREAEVHIVAWGPLAKLPPKLRNRWFDVVRIADRVGCQLMCLGPTAQDGHPRHPLMLSYESPLVRWSPP
jgi:hypothetical protein